MSIIGIDFGTTKTIAAVYRDNSFEIISDSRGRLTIPSLVLVTPEEEIFVGWEAKLHPQRYVSEHITINSIKRVLGKEQFCSWGNWKTYPQEIAALILARLKMEVDEYLDQNVTDVIISVPDHFNINQRWAVIQAAEIAGFKVLRLVNEATATAAFYTRSISKWGNAIVVDIGGGTTDVSVVVYGDGVIEVKATVGDHYIGGDDFDDLIVDHIKSVLKRKYKDTRPFSTIREFVLRNVATAAKIELSDSLSSRIFLPAFIRQDGKKYSDFDITLTRKQFNKFIDPFLKRILSLIDDAQKNSGITFKQIDKLILVGGTSRIPKIREIISQHIGLQPQGNIDPVQCVAKGAAAYAGVLQGNIKDMLLLETFSSSLSVEGPNGFAQVIIPKDTIIPTKSTKIFSTTRDFQEEIEVRIFEGESEQVKNNTYVGKLILSGIPLAQKGTPQIEVTLEIHVNKTINAEAKDKTTNKKNRAILSAPFRLNPAQVNIMSNAVLEVMKRHGGK